MTRLFRRRYVQFSLKTIALVVLVAGVVFSWWRHWLRSVELKNTYTQLKIVQDELKESQLQQNWLKARTEYQHTVLDICRAFKLDNPKHQEALTALCQMGYKSLRSSITRQSVKDQLGRSLEIVLFHRDSYSIPGSITSVVVLLHNRDVLDVIVAEASTRLWHYIATVEDVDKDGTVDVRFDYNPEMWTRREEQPYARAYSVRAGKFDEIVPPPEFRSYSVEPK